MRKTSSFLLAATALTLTAALGVSSLTACGGSGGSGAMGGGSSSGGDCFDYTSFDGTNPSVSFKSDVLPIFRNSCGLSDACHGNETGSGAQHFYGLANSKGDMTAAQIQEIFDQSVGKDSVDEPSMKVIAAGAPGNSFLMYKLDGDPTNNDPGAQVTCSKLSCASSKSCGEAMPQGGPALSADERNTIRKWIAQGAMNN
jgi:hypothetical protein